MSVPYKTTDRARSRKGRPKRSHRARRAQPPKLFVQVPWRGYMGNSFAQAHFRVRRGCYRYLVWRESGHLREFYLGKLKNPTLQGGSAAAGDPRRPPGAPAAPPVGHKSGPFGRDYAQEAKAAVLKRVRGMT